jgi:xanthine dehydrogenase YagS FAD-binding subunit
MKSFTNVNPRDVKQAVAAVDQATRAGRQVVIAGGGSDVIQLMRERIVNADVLVNLKAMQGHNTIAADRHGLTIGGLTTLSTIASHRAIASGYTVLSEAADSVATPQIRNVGTIAGNVCQRPWCWYYRNGFKCFKNGGNTCFSAAGENEFHAVFGGGPSYIVHPSDTAPALVALDAQFRIVSASGERTVAAREFFTLPTVNPATENVLRDGEILMEVGIPRPAPGTRSKYTKVMDRETWTHALVSAAVTLRMDSGTCRAARVVLGGVAPIPWALPDVESMLVGQKITETVAAEAGRRAIAGARPLAKNKYKVDLVAATVKRTVLAAAQNRA